MASVVNVNLNSKSGLQTRTTGRPLRGGNYERTPGKQSRSSHPRQRKCAGNTHPAATPRHSKPAVQGTKEVPPHSPHRRNVVHREGGYCFDAPRAGRLSRRGGGLHSRQPTPQSQLNGREGESRAQWRAEVDGLLSPLLDTIVGHGWNPTKVFLRGIQLGRVYTRNKRGEPILNVSDVAPKRGEQVSQLPATKPQITPSLPTQGPANATPIGPPAEVPQRRDVEQVCTTCDGNKY
ncbi:long-distance movement protein [Tobacco mottle virus]|uniref:Long-distance movement protein n=1 Tax=Tobacco mottle virus TaxID=136138 RepID=Q9DX76_9TOMB|nr:long-distance movement protein [Tobacco mottle virus]AAG02572.1 long-distance movement protein [Tobacco mottle virus]